MSPRPCTCPSRSLPQGRAHSSAGGPTDAVSSRSAPVGTTRTHPCQQQHVSCTVQRTRRRAGGRARLTRARSQSGPRAAPRERARQPRSARARLVSPPRIHTRRVATRSGGAAPRSAWAGGGGGGGDSPSEAGRACCGRRAGTKVRRRLRQGGRPGPGGAGQAHRQWGPSAATAAGASASFSAGPPRRCPRLPRPRRSSGATDTAARTPSPAAAAAAAIFSRREGGKRAAGSATPPHAYS